MAFAVQLAKGIFDLVRDDLALVEQEIAAQNSAAIEPVCEISSYLREGGGETAASGAASAGGGSFGVSRGERDPVGRGGGDDSQRDVDSRRRD